MGLGRRMNGCGQCVKYGMFIANLFIFLGGAAVFGIGLWAAIDSGYVNELLGTNLYMGAIYVLIVTSAIVCVLAFFGCIGAARQVKCMLLTYFILLFLIFVTMLIGGVLGFVFREKVELTMQQEMKTAIKLYEGNRYITRAWDTTQERFKCCGYDSYWDWQTRIPESCCEETYGGQKKPCRTPNTRANIYRDGCYDVVKDYVKRNAAIFGGAGIFVAVLMIMGMVFSCMLFKMIK